MRGGSEITSKHWKPILDALGNVLDIGVGQLELALSQFAIRYIMQ